MGSTIVVVRHATAQRMSPQGDRGRELTTAGVSQAHRLGQLLVDQGVAQIDDMYVSPATRTQQTAQELRDSVLTGATHVDSCIYEGGIDSLWEMIRCSAGKSVMVVGHEPTVSMLACALAEETAVSDRPFYHGMPTASAVILAAPGELSAVQMGECKVIDFVHSELR